MLGPPASGKGTQGVRLAAALGVPHVSTGELLRRSIGEGDPHGLRSLIAVGELVPDAVVEELLLPALSDGFVLDGYPRTGAQADRLDQILRDRPVEAAVEILLDEETLVARMVLRADSQHRPDDTMQTFLHRLEEYRESAPAIREHYADRLISIDGCGDEDEIFERILAALGVTQPVSGRR